MLLGLSPGRLHGSGGIPCSRTPNARVNGSKRVKARYLGDRVGIVHVAWNGQDRHRKRAEQSKRFAAVPRIGEVNPAVARRLARAGSQVRARVRYVQPGRGDLRRREMRITED